jgi:hypothetical protein
MTQKRLFFCCPAAYSEPYLRSRFNGSLSFITALGSVFPFHNRGFAHMVRDFLITEEITDMIHVHAVDSFILTNTLTQQGDTDKLLDEIYHIHFAEINQFENQQKKAASLSLYHMEYQAQQIVNHPLLLPIIIENKINLKGLLIQNDQNKSLEFNLNLALQKQ